MAAQTGKTKAFGVHALAPPVDGHTDLFADIPTNQSHGKCVKPIVFLVFSSKGAAGFRAMSRWKW